MSAKKGLSAMQDARDLWESRMPYKIAMAAGQDAGNRSMKAAGRTEWNEDDWAVACETARLMALLSYPR